MKRILALGLALALLLPAAACAGGLGGLGGAGLAGLAGEQSDDVFVPDAGEQIGAVGEVIQENYQFSEDYVCTAYSYPDSPADAEAFKTEYLGEAAVNGLHTEAVTVEGYEGYKLTAEDGRYALVFPYYGDGMLVLVENGLSYGMPHAQDCYLSFKRNGRAFSYTFDGEVSCKEARRSTGTSRSFEISCYFTRADITLFTLRFPNHVKPSTYLSVDRDRLIDGLYLDTAEEGSLVFYDSPNHHQMESSKDFFTLRINSMYESADGLVIGGEFSGSFQRGEITYTDGLFRVICDD